MKNPKKLCRGWSIAYERLRLLVDDPNIGSRKFVTAGTAKQPISDKSHCATRPEGRCRASRAITTYRAASQNTFD